MRYKRSVLGPFWISLSLAALVLGLALLYGAIFQQEFKSYVTFLLAGLVVWFHLSTMITESTGLLQESEAHLRSVPIRTPVLAARMVARNVVIFAHNLVVVLVLMLYFQTPPTPALAMVIPGFFVVTLLGFFAAQVLAPLCLRFRDISQIIANGVQLAFFVTPIIWPPNQGRVSELIVHANPFFHLIELVRAPLLGNFPTMANWVVSLSLVGGFAIAAVIVGAMSRKRLFLWL